MGAGSGYPATGGERGMMRVGDADRNRVAEILNTAFVDGRLTKDEYDTRLEGALSARTVADLSELVTDLPAGLTPVVTPPTPPPVPTTNRLAAASLAFGLGQFLVGPLATIPAIVCGHVARGQIRRTGDEGSGLALAGLLLGWGAVIVVIVAFLGLMAAGTSHGGVYPH